MVRRASSLPFAAVALLAACGPVTVRPATAPDPEIRCPGGRSAWRLRISDQRADRSDADRLAQLLRDSLARSFPGCRWIEESGTPTIAIEVHRFHVRPEYSQGVPTGFEAEAEWSVTATDGLGRILTEFSPESHISRPNYRGSNNEREALQQAFDEVFGRTSAGLRNVPPAPLDRPLSVTPGAAGDSRQPTDLMEVS
jgi:hypothetical protein